MTFWPAHMLRLGTSEGNLMKQPANPGPHKKAVNGVGVKMSETENMLYFIT